MQRLAHVLAAVALLAGCTRDLRPDGMAEMSVAAPAESGRALLAKAEAAHGGRAAFEGHRVMTVEFNDVWQGIGRLANPWPEAEVEVRMDVVRGPQTVRATFTDGEPKGARWILANGAARTVAADGEIDDEPDGEVAFILAALQYFFQFPFRIGEATVVRDVGPETVRGRTYDRVFATWGSDAPSTAYDQYVVYLDRESGQVAMIHFTVRELARFAQSTMHFLDHRAVNGLSMPHRLVLTDTPADDPAEDWLRRLTVSRYLFDAVGPGEVAQR